MSLLKRIKYRLTANKKIVKFILVGGAQKAGTTALHFYLKQVNGIVSSSLGKECDFFSADKRFRKGYNWYSNTFKSDLNEYIALDSSPGYMFNERALKRISKLPNDKYIFVVILRDPVKRAYSAYNMFKLFHSEKNFKLERLRIFNKEDVSFLEEIIFKREVFPTLKECIELELKLNGELKEPSFIKRGMYVDQLDNIYKYLPKENIVVLTSDELKKYPMESLNRVLRQMKSGIDLSNTAISLEEVGVRKYGEKIDDETRQILKDLYKKKNLELYEKYGINFIDNG